MKTYNTLAVYLGSSGHARAIFQDSATEMGRLIGEHGKRLVYGGMDSGLMGRVAKSAMRAGAKVTGIIPRNLKDSERVQAGLTETIMVNDMWDRKKRMFNISDAIITLPGGYGTVDEAMEVLYWGNLGLHNKPLVLVNIEGYWNPLITYIKSLKDYDARFLVVVNKVEDVLPALEAYCPPPQPLETPDHFPHFEDEICRDTAQAILIDVASIENTYYAVCAMGLKQLHKHKRAIGFLNDGGKFDALLEWVDSAAKERFITQDCLKLFTSGTDEDSLRVELKTQKYVEINLHEGKWGPAEKD